MPQKGAYRWGAFAEALDWTELSAPTHENVAFSQSIINNLPREYALTCWGDLECLD